MSIVTVAQVKQWVRQFHNFDDDLIQLLIDGAEDEAKQFLDRDELPRRDDPCADCVSDSTLEAASDSDDLAPTVRLGIICLVQALYEGSDAAERARMREIGIDLMKSYRCRMGV